jgi:hypothetical protein
VELGGGRRGEKRKVTGEKPAPSKHKARRMVIGGDGNELQLPVEERTARMDNCQWTGVDLVDEVECLPS